MAIPHAKSGEVVDLRPLGTALDQTITHTIVKTSDLEVIRIVLPAGKELPSHQVPGDITVHCLEGRVVFRVGDVDRDLSPGMFLYVAGGGAHALRATEDASVLVTIILKR